MISENKNNSKSRSDIYWIILSIIGAVIFFPVFTIPGYTLDPSYILGINMVISKGYVFGRNIIFTYGPLGFLSTRLPLLISNKWLFPVFDLLFTGTFIYVLVSVFRKIPLRKLYLFPLFIMTVFCTSRQFMDLSFLLCFIFIYFISTGKILHFAIAGLVVLLSFFIKLNTGIILQILYLLALIFALITQRKNRKLLLLIFGVYCILLLALAFLLKVSLPQYIFYGLQYISGHNDAMWLDVHKTNTVLFLHFALLVCLLYLFIILQIAKEKQHYFLNKAFYFFLILFFLFLLFKAGFVRADLQHIYTFFSFAMLPALLLLQLFHSTPLKTKIIYILIIPITVLSFTICGVHKISNSNILQPKQVAIYVNTLLKGNQILLDEAQIPQQIFLPEQIKRKLGKSTVDVIPSLISIAYYNKLNYTPRPIFQSYPAYTNALDNLNKDFYASEKAPEFLVFDYQSIDDRYALHDEPAGKIAMLKNYAPENYLKDNNLILLKKRNEKKISRVVINREEKISLSQKLKIPVTDNLITADINIEYNILGKLYRFFFQPPQLYITFYLENDTKHTYRAITTTISNGVIINKYIADNNDVFKLFESSFSKLENIKEISFSSAQSWGFKKDIFIKLQETEFLPSRK